MAVSSRRLHRRHKFRSPRLPQQPLNVESIENLGATLPGSFGQVLSVPQIERVLRRHLVYAPPRLLDLSGIAFRHAAGGGRAAVAATWAWGRPLDDRPAEDPKNERPTSCPAGERHAKCRFPANRRPAGAPAMTFGSPCPTAGGRNGMMGRIS